MNQFDVLSPGAPAGSPDIITSFLTPSFPTSVAKGKSFNEIADAHEGSPLVIQNFINELEYEKAHSELNL